MLCITNIIFSYSFSSYSNSYSIFQYTTSLQVFELEFEEPIAAASIGQVYKGRLKANGDMVAIKIQRPNCEEIIALDLYILRWWSGIYNKIFQFLNRDINVQSIIDDFGELIYREIDYVAEGMLCI